MKSMRDSRSATNSRYSKRMPVATRSNFAREYADWLRDRVTSVEQGGRQVISTPFLDPFHDGIRVYLEPHDGEFLLHDDGHTFENLTDSGVKLEDSEHRMNLIHRATAGCGASFVNGRIELIATAVNLPQRIHFLLTAILRLNDMWMSAVPHRWVDFFEMVAEFLDQQGVLYTPNVILPGRTVEHTIDFVIPLPRRRERLIKLVGDPKPQTAKLISFTWMELRESRPESDRVVLINDMRTPDPLGEENEQEFRRVSEQTVAILRGYSTAIYRWSEREASQFSHLWQPNGATS